MNNQQREQVLEQLKSSNHVLVTVSANPTVDELAAAIGLTLAVNKMDKHATTVFSGVVPSTIEFLQPEKTIETTTDSLRDFIISLDKSKADKLRYKVEDDVVRIFITPYRTTISDKDLEFSQGDFNVDLVIALGVMKKQDLDKAITAHGRILHGATIVTVAKRQEASDLGSINWRDEQASSFCEMIAGVVTEIDEKVLDGQMATSLLTGIIAETDRFKNSNTTPAALSLSSRLMQSGANQQLIAEKLDEPEAPPELHNEEQNEQSIEKPHGNNGELEIDHSSDEIDKIHIDENGNLNLHGQDNNSGVDEENNKPSSEADELSQFNNEDLYKNEEFKEDDPTIDNKYLVDTENSNQNDESNAASGNDLFDELSSQNYEDNESEPTLKQPDSSQTPMMQHGKVITPPSHPGDLPKSDKPFDPAEAMATAGISTDTQPQEPEQVNEANNQSLEVPFEIPQPQSPPDIEIPEISQEQPEVNEAIQTPESGDSTPSDTLADLEKSVDSPHLSVNNNQSPASVDTPTEHPAELEEAVKSLEHNEVQQSPSPTNNFEAPTVEGLNDKPQVQSSDLSNPAPPVPPPMTPQFYDADGNNSNPFNNPS